MLKLNSNYEKLSGNYLFAEMNKAVNAYLKRNPGADIIRLGIGDVTLPLSPAVIAAMHRAVDEMGDAATFRGYGPDYGYDFLIDAIIRNEYAARNIEIAPEEIFVSDGSKCDVANIEELFSRDCRVAVCDPVYPVYIDSNRMAGREIVLLPATAENDFAPELPELPVDLIYLCSPNNPTGAALTFEALTRYVDYALETGAVILYDAAYSSYIRDSSLPRSIYEIPRANEVAIEFRSFSKSAGFTGVRCAFSVVPRALAGGKLNAMWKRRMSTKYNGAPYIVQRAAEAVYSEAGRSETAAMIDYYMENAAIIRNGLAGAGLTVYGGENAPYIWWKLPGGLDSMRFFATLLESAGVVGTPGVGFGPGGEGYFRLTAFGNRERTAEAVKRIVTLGL